MATKSPVVLLVEDNADDELLALRGLRLHLPTARVCVVRNGEDALHCLQGTLEIKGEPVASSPDFVLLDLKLPFVSGFEVLKMIRELQATRLVPVVVFSSTNEPEDIRRSYSLGANSFIQKPIDLSAYMDTIGEVAHYWFETASMAN